MYWKLSFSAQGYERSGFYALEVGNAGEVTLNYALNMKNILAESSKNTGLRTVKRTPNQTAILNDN